MSREDVRREALGRRLDAEQTQEVIDKLVRAHWLRTETIETGGRSARRWHVNPKLFEGERTPPSAPEVPNGLPASGFAPFPPFPPPSM
jgi:hypothetical protein